MKKLGITSKLVLSSACILLGVGLAVTLYSLSQLQGLLYREMVGRVEAQTLNWIEANTGQITISGDPQTLARLAGELKKREDIAYVILLDTDGRQRAAANVPPDLSDLSPPSAASPGQIDWKQKKDGRGIRYFELSTPISASGTGMSQELETMFAIAAKNQNWGEVRVGVNQQEFARARAGLARQNIAMAAALILVAVGLSFVFAKRMVTPITLMGRAANQIATGNLSARVQRGTTLRDEVGDLVRNFNRMAIRLEENRDGLEEKVRDRTRELELANSRLKELDQLKSDFLSTVSHELRTPLTSIKAYAEMLQDSNNLDAELRTRFLEIINGETDRMSRLIEDFLDLTKIESGTASWMMSTSDLMEIIRTAVAVLAPSALEKEVVLDVVESEPVFVWADADRIQQVVTNLVGNAVKFCAQGGRIEVKAELRTADGSSETGTERFVRVTVADNGPGMVREEREHVFEKFYQGKKGRVERSGAGLGLTICKEIVLYHKGKIWVESEPGAGSKFYFTLQISEPGNVNDSSSPRVEGKGRL